jgi:putative FmdB family regulatory protein
MPIYEFTCDKCGHFTQEHKSMGDTYHCCTVCGESMRKAVSTPAPPVFKGSGFYKTDYKDKE